MRTIKILDLFCGAGGAAVGLRQACTDFDLPSIIDGVDHHEQKYSGGFLCEKCNMEQI